MAIYHLWLAREHALPVEPVVLLCLPNEKADDVYKDKHCVFTFRLIKLWHLEAQEIVAARQLSLYPLLPLMRGGGEWIDTAERALFESDLPRDVKADLLTILGIFLGLTDEEKGSNLLWNRSELMSILAESPIYHRIKDEGRQEGRQEGRREGLKEGIKLALEIRFGEEARSLLSEVDRSQDLELLQKLEIALRQGQSLEVLKDALTGAR